MAKVAFHDTETYCEEPISNGTYRYAEQVEVMLWGYALDDGEVKIWDATLDPYMPADLRRIISDPSIEQVWHNGLNFDVPVIKHALGIELPIESIHDTYVRALCHGLPGSLAKLCEILGVDDTLAKDKRGGQLINLFCMPHKKQKLRRATRETHPKEWGEFKDYLTSDITAMREIYNKLPRWNYSNSELALSQLDCRTNARGFCVDTELARRAVEAVDRIQETLSEQVSGITDGQVASARQRDALLDYLNSRFDLGIPNLTGPVVDNLLDRLDLDPVARELLVARQAAATSSTAKYKRLISSVSSDGRLRGTIQFCGAAKTGRDSGRLFQPQNLKRPDMKAHEIEAGIASIKNGTVDTDYTDPMRVISNATRGCIVPTKGRKLVIADLANIEGRVAAWLAGEEWKLDAFRSYDAGTGHDLYALSYAKAFGITPEEVMQNKKTGDGMYRQIGKVMELMLQYGGGVGAFITGALGYGIDLDGMADKALPSMPQFAIEKAEWMWGNAVERKKTYGLSQRTFVACDALKVLWRNAHPQISSIWKELEYAAIEAVQNPGHWIACRRLALRRDGAWLRMRLPSGRYLCYPSPQVEDGKISYKGVNQFNRKFQRLKTYGGKLFENATQAVARDVFKGTDQTGNYHTTLHAIEDAGYFILLPVHDELITETPDEPQYNADTLAALMCAAPKWADGLPLAAAGFEAYRYRKGD